VAGVVPLESLLKGLKNQPIFRWLARYCMILIPNLLLQFLEMLTELATTLWIKGNDVSESRTDLRNCSTKHGVVTVFFQLLVILVRMLSLLKDPHDFDDIPDDLLVRPWC